MNKSLSHLSIPLLALPRAAKRLLVLSVDLGLCILSIWLAYYLRLGEFINFNGQSAWSAGAVWASATSVALALPIFIVLGLYRAIFRYSGWPALLTVAQAVGIYGLLYASVFTVFGFPGVPRTIGIIQPILLLLLVGASRALARVWLGDQYTNILQRSARPKALIYGAGSTGRQLAAAMANSLEIQVVGFVDDDDRLHGHV
ncbi:MAG: polysaccharide biosynthesis protein, partial [Betaproteobacteria bacterium]|nr:polysaccharide biosynthesis protein [Betaproteobacteria bacterium]